jgi:hypothetical protein
LTKHKNLKGPGGKEPHKLFEVKVELTDTILGRDEEDAIEEFKVWLNRHVKDWKIISVTPTGGTAW